MSEATRELLLQIPPLLVSHLLLVFGGVAIACLVALPLAVWITRPGNEEYEGLVLGLAGVGQTVPSLAVIGLAAGFLGIGVGPTLAALVALGILPVLGNATVGLQSVPPQVLRAARGQGLSPAQRLRMVELPMALPVILAGVRTATVLNVGSAALAAEIGADCLGNLIFQGIANGRLNLVLAGAIPTALLAILLDELLGLAEKRFVSPGLRLAAKGGA